MGAEGGIQWICLKDKLFKTRFIYLTSFFESILESIYKEEDIAQSLFVYSNYPNAIAYSYTSYHKFQSLETLLEIIKYDDEEDHLIFEELISHICSINVYNTIGEHSPELLRVIHDMFKYEGRNDVLQNAENIRVMKISDWKEELRNMIDFPSFKKIETWT